MRRIFSLAKILLVGCQFAAFWTGVVHGQEIEGMVTEALPGSSVVAVSRPGEYLLPGGGRVSLENSSTLVMSKGLARKKWKLYGSYSIVEVATYGVLLRSYKGPCVYINFASGKKTLLPGTHPSSNISMQTEWGPGYIWANPHSLGIDANGVAREVTSDQELEIRRNLVTNERRRLYEVTDDSTALRYGPLADTQNQRRLKKSRAQSISELPVADFVALRSGLHQYNTLIHLPSGRAFDLGVLAANHEPLFDAGSEQIVFGGDSQITIDLRALRIAIQAPVRRWGSIARTAASALTSLDLTTCGRGSAGIDAVGRELLNLRQASSGQVSEAALSNVLMYRLSGSELKLIAQIFQRLLLEDPINGLLWFRRLDLYDRLEPLAGTLIPNPCLEDFAVEALRAKMQDFVTLAGADGNGRPLDFTAVAPQIVYGPYFKKFGLDTEVAQDHLGDRMAIGAQQTAFGSGIFYSKLYYFARAAMEPIFGLPRSFKTDVTTVASGRDATVVLLSSYPTQELKSKRNAFGYYSASPGVISVEDRKGAQNSRSFGWRSLRGPMRADIKVTYAADLRELVPHTSGPDYQRMRQDGRLTGLMVIGTALSYEDGERTFHQYRDYYAGEKGYVFEEQQIDDFPTWLKDHVVSGEIDYLIKEAHSGGDEKNLFQTPGAARLYLGRKRGSDGRLSEVIYLVAPQVEKGIDSYGHGSHVSNQAFGEWLRQRQANGGGPLVYINSSCSSYVKAVAEITAARTPLLVEIASVTGVSEFVNIYPNVTRALLDGLLADADWATMRKIMDKRNSDSRSQTSDRFVLPNEDEYDRDVRQSLEAALESEVHIYDAEGVEVNIEQYNRHAER